MVAWHVLVASSLPHFLAESSEAASIPFQGGIQVLQHTQECPLAYCCLCSYFTPTGQHATQPATQPAGYRQGTGACMRTYVLHTHILTARTHGSAEYSHIRVHKARPLGLRALMMFGIKYGWQGIGNAFVFQAHRKAGRGGTHSAFPGGDMD